MQPERIEDLIGVILSREFQGNPAKQIGWVGKAGYKLEVDDDEFKCPETNMRYKLTNEGLEEILIK